MNKNLVTKLRLKLGMRLSPYLAPQARLKVLKHRDDHVASVMDEAKVGWGLGQVNAVF